MHMFQMPRDLGSPEEIWMILEMTVTMVMIKMTKMIMDGQSGNTCPCYH